MPTELIKKLLEAGVHFGHQTKRWNPKMKKFIFGRKGGIYIIDLEKTVICLEEAQIFLKDAVTKDKSVLFVGTKKQAKDIIKQEAERCGMFYVSERWIGGLLTNFATITKRIKRLKEIKKMQEDGTLQKFTKKENAGILKEKLKLQKDFEGIEEMRQLPGAMFIIDSTKEENAVKEARKLGIPIVALIDTNCNPDEIDYPVPGNDDAIKSIELMTSLISSTVLEARDARTKIEEAGKTEEAAETEKPEDAKEAVEKADSKGSAAVDSEKKPKAKPKAKRKAKT